MQHRIVGQKRSQTGKSNCRRSARGPFLAAYGARTAIAPKTRPQGHHRAPVFGLDDPGYPQLLKNPARRDRGCVRVSRARTQPLCCSAHTFKPESAGSHAEWHQERSGLGIVETPDVLCRALVQVADREVPYKPAIQPCLATVTLSADPAQVLQGECPPERRLSQRPGDVDVRPMVLPGRRSTVALTHREVHPIWLLPGGHPVGSQTVGMPSQVYRGS